MKKFLAIASAAAAIAAVSSGAMAADQNIDVTATVEGFCSIGGSTGTVSPNATIGLGSFGAGGITAATGTADLGAVICNKAASASLVSTNGALLGPAASGSMQNYINYSATTTGLLTQAAVTADITTGTASSKTSGSVPQANAFSAPAVTVVVTPVAATPLVAGNYSDVLTFAIVPQ